MKGEEKRVSSTPTSVGQPGQVELSSNGGGGRVNIDAPVDFCETNLDLVLVDRKSESGGVEPPYEARAKSSMHLLRTRDTANEPT